MQLRNLMLNCFLFFGVISCVTHDGKKIEKNDYEILQTLFLKTDISKIYLSEKRDFGNDFTSIVKNNTIVNNEESKDSLRLSDYKFDLELFRKNKTVPWNYNNSFWTDSLKKKIIIDKEFLKFKQIDPQDLLKSKPLTASVSCPIYSDDFTIAIVKTTITTPINLTGFNSYLIFKKIKNKWVEFGKISIDAHQM